MTATLGHCQDILHEVIPAQGTNPAYPLQALLESRDGRGATAGPTAAVDESSVRGYERLVHRSFQR